MFLHLRGIQPVTFAVALASVIVCCADAEGVPLNDREEYQAALRALRDGMPQVAVLKLERLRRSNELSHGEERRVAEQMVDALIRAKEAKRALAAIALLEVPEANYWKAEALLIQGAFREAEAALREYLSEANPRYAAYARLALGQVLIGQRRENTGRKEFREVMDSPDPRVARIARLWMNESEMLSERAPNVLRRLEQSDPNDRETEFVKACAMLESGDADSAERIFRRMMSSEEERLNSARLQHALVVRRAEAYAALNQPANAVRLLSRFINEVETGPFLEQAFAEIDRLKGTEDDDIPERYARWAGQAGASERKSYAMFYHARWLVSQGKTEDALRELESFRKMSPDHPRHGEATLLLMGIHGAQHDDDRVLELAREWRARHASGGEDIVDFLTGMIRFSRKEFADAAKLFEKSAEAAGDVLQKQRAIFNMGVAAFFGKDVASYSRAVSMLLPAAGVPVDAESSAANLELERALMLAGKRDSGAEAALKDFVAKHGASPRVAEAELALAELVLLDLPARTKAAQTAIESAAARPDLDPALLERIDYTRVWLCEANEDSAGVSAAGQDFLNKWPKSLRRDEVRMKVAQAYFRAEDFPRSRAQFEQLVEEHPDSPFAEAAQFFAGRAAVATLNPQDLERALGFFEEVVLRKGALAVEARRQQARIKRIQGQESDALAVIETILSGKPAPSAADAISLKIEKGELLALLARKDPRNLDEAVAVFRGVVADAGVPRIWHSRAGVLLAQTLQRQGKPEEALEACFHVIDSGLAASAGAASPQELVWIYRAGFIALEILEARQQWDGAAKLADRLAKTTGERAAEFKERGTKIKTDHFIWDRQ